MKERPILFSGPMVRAILEGRKTQTRRVIKPQPCGDFHCVGNVKENTRRGKVDMGFHAVFDKPREMWLDDEHPARDFRKSPYGQPDDRLWVRETWDFRTWEKDKVRIAYGAGGFQEERTPPPDWHPMVYNYERWRPSIHMPRWACRLVLEVVAVRVERLNDISEEDAKAEGSYLGRCPCLPRERDKSAIEKLFQQTRCHIHDEEFRELWDSINAARGYGWSVNPWVWVVNFKKIEPEARIGGNPPKEES